MKTLGDLLSPLPEARIINGTMDLQVTQLCYDSRKVVIGSAFIYVPRDIDLDPDDVVRASMDTIALDAVRRGAVAVVSENKSFLLDLPNTATKVLVADARKALGLMSAEFYDHPSRKMVLVGVTGTNGKTTTANLTAEILRRGGFKSVGVIGTLGATTENTILDTGCTTPRSLDVQRILSDFIDAGVEAVAIEVSSHGLELQRVVGCAFDVAVFTNFTQDHLDFHGSMEAYWAAKKLFFTDIAKYSMQSKRFAAIINIDDPYGRKLIPEAVESGCYEYFTYGIEGNSDFKAEDVKISTRKLEFTIKNQGAEDLVPFDVSLTGRFNVYNCLAAASVGHYLKVPIAKIQEGLNAVKAPMGRMERIEEGQSFNVIVDFAHSPGALQEVLTALRESLAGRLICVFGTSGRKNADITKRLNMGSVVAGLADIIVITSDNPRWDNPQKIMEDVFLGVKSKGKESVTKLEVDRKKAIEYALEIARDGDTVVFAGKGHETYQQIDDEKLPFNEREIVRDALKNRLKARGSK